MLSVLKYLTSTFHLELSMFIIEINHGSMMNVNGHTKRDRKLTIFGEEIALNQPGIAIKD